MTLPEVRQQLTPPLAGAVDEYRVRSTSYAATASFLNPQTKKCPRWMKMGFFLYRLEGLAFNPTLLAAATSIWSITPLPPC
jgi:hypothetical protein